MSSIPPLPPSGWNGNVNPPSSVENQGGGGGAPGYTNQESEKTDEATFSTSENKADELEFSDDRNLFMIIKDFIFSLWTGILELLGIKSKDSN